MHSKQGLSSIHIHIDTTLFINTNAIQDVLFYENLYCHFACNLQVMKSLIKNMANLKSIKFHIFYWHAKRLATKASGPSYDYIIYLIIYLLYINGIYCNLHDIYTIIGK